MRLAKLMHRQDVGCPPRLVGKVQLMLVFCPAG
jgi:hypothetical protein